MAADSFLNNIISVYQVAVLTLSLRKVIVNKVFLGGYYLSWNEFITTLTIFITNC